MRVAMLGNFRPRTALGEPLSTESHLAATYELLGHQALRLQEDTTSKRSIPASCQEFGADLFHWVATWHNDHDGAFWMLDELRRAGIPSVGYTLDLFVGLDRETWLDIDPWFRTDFFFSADGGHPEVWAAKGINHHWMPPAVFAPECYIAEPVPELVQDVVFVGSYGYHAQWPYRKILIDWLKTTYGERFTHYDHSSGMRGHRLNQLYASAAIVIGDSCCPGFRQENYFSDRACETPGRGGFLIHPRNKALERCFVEDEEMVFYDYADWLSLRTKIDFYLEHNLERETIRRKGHFRAKDCHTYTHRLRELLAAVDVKKHEHSKK